MEPRKVKIKTWIPEERKYSDGKDRVVEGTGCFSEDYEREGILIHWGLNYQGICTYTVGIVELPDGTVEEVYPTSMKFIGWS